MSFYTYSLIAKLHILYCFHRNFTFVNEYKNKQESVT